MTVLSLKIDVDTERGTKEGIPNLLNLFRELEMPATFLFALGPDNTGRAIKRIFRPGFLKKVSRALQKLSIGFSFIQIEVFWWSPRPLFSKKGSRLHNKTGGPSLGLLNRRGSSVRNGTCVSLLEVFSSVTSTMVSTKSY